MADTNESLPAEYSGYAPAPHIVQIDTTLACNLACPMCDLHLSGSTQSGVHMADELLERLAEQIFPFVPYIRPTLTGEPLIAPGHDRFLELVRESGSQVHMTTNATALTEKKLRELLPITAFLSVSMDAASKQTYEKIRVGAVFERTIERLETLQRLVAELPEERRPYLTLNATLSRWNIHELVPFVELGARLGFHHVDVQHMYPWTPELGKQSLVHDIEGAKSASAQALQRAKELNISLHIRPLDAITASMAQGTDRGHSAASEQGLWIDRYVFSPEGARTLPQRRTPDDKVEEIRAKAAERHWFPVEAKLDSEESGEPPRAAGLDEIWVCDWLWHQSIVDHVGGVRPCCVDGAPLVGTVHEQRSFADIWNGESYRELRRRLLYRDPAPLCRNCGCIRKVTDPQEQKLFLGNCRVSGPTELGPLPDLLRAENLRIDPSEEERHATRGARVTRVSATPPAFRWPNAPGSYRVDFSLDGFASIVASSELLDNCQYQLSAELWAQARAGMRIAWRVVSIQDGSEDPILSGEIEVVAAPKEERCLA